MIDMDDAEFLSYCEAHCTTERHLFSTDHCRRLYALAGVVEPAALACGSGLWAMDAHLVNPLVRAAREATKLAETLPCPWHPGQSHRALDLCTPGVVLPVGNGKQRACFTCANKCAEPDPDGLPRYPCTGGMHTVALGDAVCTCACHRGVEAPPDELIHETPLPADLLAVLTDPAVSLPGVEDAARCVLAAAAEGRVAVTPRSARCLLATLDRLLAERKDTKGT